MVPCAGASFCWCHWVDSSQKSSLALGSWQHVRFRPCASVLCVRSLGTRWPLRAFEAKTRAGEAGEGRDITNFLTMVYQIVVWLVGPTKQSAFRRIYDGPELHGASTMIATSESKVHVVEAPMLLARVCSLSGRPKIGNGVNMATTCDQHLGRPLSKIL